MQQQTDEALKALWEAFGDAPIYDDETLEEPFLHFDSGTPRFDVWHWFDKYHSEGVAALQGVNHDRV